MRWGKTRERRSAVGERERAGLDGVGVWFADGIDIDGERVTGRDEDSGDADGVRGSPRRA